MGNTGAGFPVSVRILVFKVVNEGGADLVHGPDGMFGEGGFGVVVVGHD